MRGKVTKLKPSAEGHAHLWVYIDGVPYALSYHSREWEVGDKVEFDVNSVTLWQGASVPQATNLRKAK